MREIRIHCRGGQGGLTCARIIVDAALKDGKMGQAFPQFGPERQGAPVKSFARIDKDFVRVKATIDRPDVVMVFDRGLLFTETAVSGLKSGGILLVNSEKLPANIPSKENELTVAWVDATALAKEKLGREIPNTAMLGAFSKATKLIDIEAMKQAIVEWFGDEIGQKNSEVAKLAFDQTKVKKLSNLGEPDKKSSNEYSLIEDYPQMVTSKPKVGAIGKTGSWRVEKPIIDDAECVGCWRCFVFCPEGVIKRNREDKKVEVDFDYCKSCGICVEVCPTEAITMEKVNL